MMIIILYFTNSINILKQKPPCKACSHIRVACDVSVNCLIMMGPYEYFIPWLICATAVEDTDLYQFAPLALHITPSKALAFATKSRLKDQPALQ